MGDRLTLSFQTCYCSGIIELVLGLGICDHSFFQITTGVISINTLTTPVLTSINDIIIGSDKLFKICCSYECPNILLYSGHYVYVIHCLLSCDSNYYLQYSYRIFVQ